MAIALKFVHVVASLIVNIKRSPDVGGRLFAFRVMRTIALPSAYFVASSVANIERPPDEGGWLFAFRVKRTTSLQFARHTATPKGHITYRSES